MHYGSTARARPALGFAVDRPAVVHDVEAFKIWWGGVMALFGAGSSSSEETVVGSSSSSSSSSSATDPSTRFSTRVSFSAVLFCMCLTTEKGDYIRLLGFTRYTTSINLILDHIHKTRYR